MLKLDKNRSTLEILPSRTLVDARILERSDLQKMIVSNPHAFFDEMRERLELIGEEVKPSDHVNDSIDLLAIDENGLSIIIELKRDEQKLQLLQALSYASMLSDWSAEDFFQHRSIFKQESLEEARLAIVDHLDSKEVKEINVTQRVILIAEKFDYGLLKTAEWLTEKYGVGIRCYRIELITDNDSEYLACSLVYPPLEIIDQASRARRNKNTVSAQTSATWEDGLKIIKNSAVKDFFNKADNLGEKTSKGDLAFRINSKRRFWVCPRAKFAYVWQKGRFNNDVVFWKENLSNPSKVEPIEKNKCVRFYLETPNDFGFFEKEIKGYIAKQEFLISVDEDLEDDNAV